VPIEEEEELNLFVMTFNREGFDFVIATIIIDALGSFVTHELD
jgi:hypothetical protein